jgi:hypothetical protein
MNNLLPSGYVMTADGQILYSGPRFDVPPVGSNGDGPDADSMGDYRRDFPCPGRSVDFRVAREEPRWWAEAVLAVRDVELE